MQINAMIYTREESNAPDSKWCTHLPEFISKNIFYWKNSSSLMCFDVLMALRIQFIASNVKNVFFSVKRKWRCTKKRAKTEAQPQCVSQLHRTREFFCRTFMHF